LLRDAVRLGSPDLPTPPRIRRARPSFSRLTRGAAFSIPRGYHASFSTGADLKDEQVHPFTNRLAQESSPYLLQHAHNPVDWYPWGPEAFEASRKQNKPIFLSVGYSTCYWCHVMERQSFEVEAVASEMNKRFINVKVDREERPDVDQLYMTAVQVLTRQGGWPMSVFLAPDLRPFYGGTYFPPTDNYGRPGFVSILRGIEDAYRNRPGDVEKTAEQLVNLLRQFAEPSGPEAPVKIDEAFVEGLIRRSVSDYDAKHGGFGGAPKFPRETLLELLLVWLRSSAPASAFKSQVSRMLRHTLDALADGGIRDQLGGGFHRYSTDAHWLVPHFEIMLYDNAMLAWCYVEAFAQTKEPRDAEVARGVFDFVLREMTSPEGAFYTAIDAEVDSQEGLNYLWTAGEIQALLGPQDAAIFNKVYGVARGPNFADPHHGSGVAEKNILFLPQPIAKTAAELRLDAGALEARLAPMRQKLYEARMKRKQPLLDTKVITSWDALMIRALAHGGKVLNEPRYVAAAEKAAGFLLDKHRAPAGGLFRTSRDGVAKYHGFLDDYAFLVQALLALAEATGTVAWKDRAADLSSMMIEKFGDAIEGGFFFTEKDATDLIVRQKTGSDSPLPSGNAVAAMALLELGLPTEPRWTLAKFVHSLASQGEGMSAMVQAALLYLRKHGSFEVSANPLSPENDAPIEQAEYAKLVVSAEAKWRTPADLVISLRIASGFHINAHDVPASEGLVATRLTVLDDPSAEVNYPKGEQMQFPFVDKPISVYSNDLQISVRFSSPRKMGPAFQVTLVYQACNDSACMPPVMKQIDVGTGI
jgi:hypothetical protein